jgi:hypothetical protein
MARVRASTTDVCPYRAAHPAWSVRLVQITPAADALEPGRWHRHKHARAAAGAAGRAANTAGRRRATTAPTQPLRRTAIYARTNARVSTIAQRTQTHATWRQRGVAHAHGIERRTCAAERTGRTTEQGRRKRRQQSRRRSRDCRSHACTSISYAIRRCCAAQVPATAARRNCLSHLAIYPPIYAQSNAHALMCIHRYKYR